MKAKKYKGFNNNEIYPYHFIIRNMEYDISIEKDGKGLPYKFIEIITCKGEIKSWNPFKANYKSYTGEQIEVAFICPVCGSSNCERPEQKKFSDPYFFQGHFKCSECSTGEYCYYSDCFIKKINQEKQLSLF